MRNNVGENIKVLQYKRQKPGKEGQEKNGRPSISVEQAGLIIGIALLALTIALLVGMFLLSAGKTEKLFVTDAAGNLYSPDGTEPLIEGEHTLLAADPERGRLLYLQDGGLYIKEGEEALLLSQPQKRVVAEPVCYDEAMTTICWREYDRQLMLYCLCLWQDGKETVLLEGGKTFLSYLRLSPDAGQLAYSIQDVSGDNTLIVRDLEKETSTEIIHSSDYIACYAVTDQGRALYYDYRQERLCLSGVNGSGAETILASRAADIEVNPDSCQAAVLTFDGMLYQGDFREGELKPVAQAEKLEMITAEGVYYRAEGSLYYAQEGRNTLVAEDAQTVCALGAGAVLLRLEDGIYRISREGNRFGEAVLLCGTDAEVLLRKEDGACAFVEDGWLYYVPSASAKRQRLRQAEETGILEFGAYSILYQDPQGRLCSVYLNGGGYKIETEQEFTSVFIVFS